MNIERGLILTAALFIFILTAATSLSHAELGIDFKWEFQFVLQAKTKYNNKIISGAAFGSVCALNTVLVPTISRFY